MPLPFLKYFCIIEEDRKNKGDLKVYKKYTNSRKTLILQCTISTSVLKQAYCRYVVFNEKWVLEDDKIS